MKYDFTEEEKRDVIQMYQNDTRIDEILEKYNTEEHYIRMILKENKIDRDYNTWKDEMYNRICFLYSLGNKTHKDIAYDLCCSDNAVMRTLHRKHVQMKTTSEANQKYKRNSHYFSNIDTPNKAYVLGLIYSDGNVCLSNGHSVLTITLQEEDVDVLKRIKDEMEYEGPLRYVEKSKENPNYKNTYGLVINDPIMIQDLINLGVVPRKSLIITFPTWLRPDLVRHFIRGYFDGDGNIYYDKKRHKANASLCGTYEFDVGVRRFCEAFYINSNIYHPKQCEGKNTYILQFAATESTYNFLSWIYQNCDIKMQRKYESYLDIKEKYVNHKSNIKSF